jgi:hypothetical protein
VLFAGGAFSIASFEISILTEVSPGVWANIEETEKADRAKRGKNFGMVSGKD